MDIEAFRLKVRDVCRQSGFSQKQLAAEMNLHPTKLSHKLNNSPSAPLTHPDVRQIVTVLASWQAITERGEALELLTLGGLSPNSFSEKDWNSSPLNQLAQTAPTPKSTRVATLPPPPLDYEEEHLPEAASSSYSVKHNLPVPVTPLVGRRQEISRITELLHRADLRLLTLTGIGGVGKTRLSLAAGFEVLADFEHGVHFVDLAAITEPERVAPEIARVFGLLEETAGKRKPLSMLDTLKNYLAKRHLLLILDNFEQILGAATIVRELLSAASGVKILVTSRFLLRLYGEYEYSVEPLSLPERQTYTELENLAQNEAVALFIQRARAVRPDFRLSEANAAVVADICIWLEGLPLAIELAVARLRLFTPQMLLDKLRQRLNFLTSGSVDQAARHRTLRATIEWSYDLLSPAERLVFARFAVFRGGCSLEALQEVAGFTPLNPDEVLDLAAALIEKSVFKVSEENGESRLYMLETVREYALEKLLTSSESAELARRQATYFLQFAETAAPYLKTKEVLGWHAKFRVAAENFQQALNYLSESGPLEDFLRLVVAYSSYLHSQCYMTDGYKWTTLAIQKAEQAGYESLTLVKVLADAGAFALDITEPTWAEKFFRQTLLLAEKYADSVLVGRAYRGLGRMYSLLGNFKQADAHLQLSLSNARQRGDDFEAARTLSILGSSNMTQGNYEVARLYSEESITLHRKSGAAHLAAGSISTLGGIALFQSNYELAKRYLQEAMTLHRKFGNRLSLAGSLNSSGIVAKQMGDYAAARRFLQECQVLNEEAGNRQGWMGARTNLALVASDEGDYEQAWDIHSELLEQWRELNNQMGIASCLYSLGDVSLFRGDYPAALKFHQEGLALRQEIGDRKGIGYSFYEVGRIARSLGQYEFAQACLQESLALREQLTAKTNLAETCHELGLLARVQGNYVEAADWFQRGVDYATAAGAIPAKTSLLASAGELAVFREQFEQARQCLDEARHLAQTTGRKQTLAVVLQYQALLELKIGQLSQASKLIEESMALRRINKQKSGLAEALVTFLLICRQTGKTEQAEQAEQDLQAFIASSNCRLEEPYASCFQAVLLK